MRSQIFRQIAQKFRRQTWWSQSILVRHAFVLEQNPASNAVVWQGISGQYGGKSASRLRTKPSGRLCAVFPMLYYSTVSAEKQGKHCIKPACEISMQSAEKSDYASYAQALFSVSLTM